MELQNSRLVPHNTPAYESSKSTDKFVVITLNAPILYLHAAKIMNRKVTALKLLNYYIRKWGKKISNLQNKVKHSGLYSSTR